MTTFAELKLSTPVLEAIEKAGWTKPTDIQRKAIPLALSGKDIVGLAVTGSGKTAAFVIPIIEWILKTGKKHAGLILTPTVELARQAREQFDLLGKPLGLHVLLLVGGEDKKQQQNQLNLARSNLLIATPGRFLDHLRSTKHFNESSLQSIKFLVLDEADQMLERDFGRALDQIFGVLPSDRITYLYSATMTKKVLSLQRAGLRKGHTAMVNVSSKYELAQSLSHYYLLMPHDLKAAYLYVILKSITCSDAFGADDVLSHYFTETKVKSVIVFVRTQETSNKLALGLADLGIPTEAFNGRLPKNFRAAACKRFRSANNCVMIATNIAGRGLDFVNVDLVINYDLTLDAKIYQHRVGRTARNDRPGIAINLVDQYSVIMLAHLEEVHGDILCMCRDQSEKEQLLKQVMEFAPKVRAVLSKSTLELTELSMKRKKAGDVRKRKFVDIKNPHFQKRRKQWK